MSSTRAQAVADVLFELKRAEKLGTLSGVAKRAGFTPGVNGKTALNVLETVRREWAHLDWWRVVRDDAAICHAEQVWHLEQAGFSVSDDKKTVEIEAGSELLWSEGPIAAPSKPIPMN